MSTVNANLMAAGGSSSSEPKLPWPSTSCTRMEKSWARRTCGGGAVATAVVVAAKVSKGRQHAQQRAAAAL